MGLIRYQQAQKTNKLLAAQNKMLAEQMAADPNVQAARAAEQAEAIARRDRKYDRKLAKRAARKGMRWDDEKQAYIAQGGHAVIPTQVPEAEVQGQLHPGTNRPCGRWCRSDHR